MILRAIDELQRTAVFIWHSESPAPDAASCIGTAPSLCWLFPRLRKSGDGRGRVGFDGLELLGGDVGDADCLKLLMFRKARIFRGLLLCQLGVVALTKLVRPRALPVELLEQLPAPPNRARLDAAGEVEQRLVVSVYEGDAFIVDAVA